MTKLINADALIEDLEFDIELDQRALDNGDIDHSHREITQFDKDCKQNTVYLLRKAPAVDAEPVRHAHWVWKGDEGDSRFMCSACGGKENAPTCMGVPNIWEYCPNCGARMEEYELERKRTDTETD